MFMKKIKAEVKQSWWEKIIEERAKAAAEKKEKGFNDWNAAIQEETDLLVPNKIWILADELKKVIDDGMEAAQQTGRYESYPALREPHIEQMQTRWKQSHEVLEEIKNLAKGEEGEKTQG